MIHLLAPLSAFPIKANSILHGMIQGLLGLMTLPDSLIGAVIAVLVLLSVVAARRFRGSSADYQANIGDLAAVVYVGLQFVTLFTSVSYPNTLHFITPSVIALCGYFAVRLLAPSAAVQTVLYRVAVTFGLLLALADYVTWTTEVHILDSFPRTSLAALHANLPLVGGPTQNDSIMLVLAIVPYALASWALERGRNRWFSFLSLSVTAALAVLLVLSFSRGIYLALAVLAAAAFTLLQRHGAWSFRPLGSLALMVGVPVVVAVIAFGVQRDVLETVRNKSMSEQRSTMGRFVTWRDSLHAIEKHPLLGTGGYSDGLESLEWLRDSPEKTFTARTYNAPLEALLCSGLIGLLSYGTFLIYPVVRFVRGSRVDAAGSRGIHAYSFLTAGLIALMVRDMTYSSLVLDGRTLLIAWVAVALLQNFIATPKHEIAGANDQAA